MLDSSCSETPKTKKKTAQNRPVQRFWPDSIASGVAQQQSNELTMSDGKENGLVVHLSQSTHHLQFVFWEEYFIGIDAVRLLLLFQKL